MQTQLKVIKEDGSTEEYLHTKVMGTIGNALASVGQADTYLAEQLAEVVTYYLYRKRRRRSVTSSEILSMVKAVLAGTCHEEAAVALSEHHFERRLKRSRIQVASVDAQRLDGAELLACEEVPQSRCRWDKTRIVEDLVEEQGISRQTARTIAGMVEEKVFRMGMTLVPAGLIKQLVVGDTAAVLRAEEQLQTV